MLIDAWLFTVVCSYALVAYALWYAIDPPEHFGYFLTSLYLCALVFELFHVIVLFFYSLVPWRDARICIVMPLMPFYQLFMLGIRVVATTQELVWRKSFDDDYVPQRVRQATWRW